MPAFQSINGCLTILPENTATEKYPGAAMGETNQLQALRRLAKQADALVSAQLNMIDGLMRAKLPTEGAEAALSAMRRTVADLHGRLKVLTAA
jgi:hypothetical protein